MNVLSLFDGISCGQQALKMANIPYDNYYASEIDKKAIQVTQCNFPNTKQMGDVHGLTSSMFPQIDLLFGGSPCQSFSNAISNNTGFGGKSGLIKEYERLLHECNPKYFLLENVLMRKEWENVITSMLNVKPIMLDAAWFGAQSRERLYWTNISLQSLPSQSNLVLKDVLEPVVDEKYFYKEGFTMVNKGPVEALLHINGHDLIKRVNSKQHKCQCLTAVCGGNQQRKVIDNNRVRKLTPMEYERLQGLSDGYTVSVSNSARYRAIGNGWSIPVIAYILSGVR